MMTQDTDNADAPHLDRFVAAYRAETLPDEISQAARTAPQSTRKIAQILASLHNAGEIDLVASVEGLKPSPTGPDFFLVRRVFEESLPQLSADIRAVLRCVLALWRSAGRDLLAGTIVGSYARFCGAERSRVDSALQAIEESPTDFAPLLSTTVASGAKLDLKHFLQAAVRLCDHADIRLRGEAVRSLGLILRTDGKEHVPTALAKLEELVERETDDGLLAATVSAACSMAAADQCVISRARSLLEGALCRGDEITLHAASEVFGLDSEGLPEPLRDELLRHLPSVNPANKGTIQHLDQGISQLLVSTGRLKAIQLLETLLLGHRGKLSIHDFRLAEHAIQADSDLLSELATRWFLLGDPTLCAAIGESIVRSDSTLEMKCAHREAVAPLMLLFAARKAIGYLFLQPVCCAQFIVSLMANTDDEPLLNDLQKLLVCPLLINFTGSVRAFVAERSSADPSPLKSRLDAALRQVDGYLDGLHSVGELPALHPSARQRAAHHRHIAAEFADATKTARSQSQLLQLIRTRSVLYGRSAVTYVDSRREGSERVEIEMKEHGFQIEIPRSQHLDMVGLDEMLKIFRMEQLQP
jgi:hypothetical protein